MAKGDYAASATFLEPKFVNLVSCIINGTVVKTIEKRELVTAGKLKSADDVYGVRFAHNTDATVTGLKVTKP